MSRETSKNRSLEDLQKLPIIGITPANEKEEAFLREICEFEFVNVEEPGLSQQFPYGNTKKYHRFFLMHGGRYKLPRFIARWIESRSTPIWDYRPDGKGGLKKTLIGRNPRFQMRQVYGE